MRAGSHGSSWKGRGRGWIVLGTISALLGIAGCGGGDEWKPSPAPAPVVTAVLPGQGISVQQVDFDFPGGTEYGSTWGRLVLDPSVMSRAANLRDGYVSVVTSKGWAVANVPVPAAGQPAHAIFFDLGLEQAGTVLDTVVEVRHSSVPLEDIRQYLEAPVTFPVQSWLWRAYGVGPWAELEKLAPPKVPPYTFQLTDRPVLERFTFSHLQDVTNVECALNQCFPMAVANGLQFLEDGGWIAIPNDHGMGIGVTGDPTANTLVAQLDFYSDRSVTTRTNGSGVWFEPMIDGTFEYLQDNGLDGILTFRHQDRGYGSTIPAGNYTAYGSTSLDDGATVSWNWIDDRIQDGCAISMVFIAHAVRITGSGRTLGRPWIRYSHDANQFNDSVGRENVICFLDDPDNNGLLNFGGSSNEIRWVWAACP